MDDKFLQNSLGASFVISSVAVHVLTFRRKLFPVEESSSHCWAFTEIYLQLFSFPGNETRTKCKLLISRRKIQFSFALWLSQSWMCLRNIEKAKRNVSDSSCAELKNLWFIWNFIPAKQNVQLADRDEMKWNFSSCCPRSAGISKTSAEYVGAAGRRSGKIY